MKTKIFKFLIILGIAFLFNLILSTTSKAALSVTSSKTTVTPGESFNVVVSVSNNEAGHITLSATNATLSNTNIDLMTQPSVTVRCTAGSSGQIVINATGLVASYSTNPETGEIQEIENTQNADTYVNIQQQSQGGSNSSGSNSGSSGTSKPTKPETPTTPTKSSNANLKNLGIRPNDFKGFKPSTETYNVTVPNDVSKVEVYAEVQDSKAKISSGTGSKTLNEGANELKVVVTAEDGTTKTYTINVTRQKKEDNEEKPETPDEMEVFGLSDLQILGVTLRPSFKTDVYEYKIELKNNDINKLDIKAVGTEANSKVEILGNEELKEGENIITITVTDETGEKNVSYQITVNKVIVKDDIVAKTSNEDNSKKQFIIIIAIAIIISIIIVVFIVKYRRKPNSAFDTDGLYYGVDLDEDNNTDNDDKFRKDKDSMNEEFGDIFKDGEDEFPPRKKPRGKRFK